MNFFRNHCLPLDIFALRPSLYTNGNAKHKTILGAFIFLSILSFYLSGVIYFSQDIFYKTNPEVIRSAAIENNPPNFKIEPNDFSIAFALSDVRTYMAFRNESIYYPEFYTISLENGALKERRKLRAEPCSLENFKGVDESIFDKNFPFSSFYCIAKDEQLSMIGVLASKTFRYLQVQVKVCNETLNPGYKCASPEEIAQHLNGATAYYYYIDKYYTPSDFNQPVKSFFKQYITTVSSQMFTALVTTLKKITVFDDPGWLFQERKELISLGVHELTKQIDFRNVGHFLEITCFLSESQDIIDRKYKKIQHAMAEMGGFIALLKFFLGGVCAVYSQKQLLITMTQSLFNLTKITPKNKTSKLELVKIRNSESNADETLDPNLKSLDLAKANEPTKANVENHRLRALEAKKEEIWAMDLIKKALDVREFLLITKELKLLKLLLLGQEDWATYEKIISSKNSSKVLFLSMKDCYNLIGQNLEGERMQKLNTILKNLKID